MAYGLLVIDVCKRCAAIILDRWSYVQLTKISAFVFIASNYDYEPELIRYILDYSFT